MFEKRVKQWKTCSSCRQKQLCVSVLSNEIVLFIVRQLYQKLNKSDQIFDLKVLAQITAGTECESNTLLGNN